MKKLLVILMVTLSIFMVGCGSQETKTSNQNEVERKEYVDSRGETVYTIDDEYARTLEYNSKKNQY